MTTRVPRSTDGSQNDFSFSNDKENQQHNQGNRSLLAEGRAQLQNMGALMDKENDGNLEKEQNYRSHEKGKHGMAQSQSQETQSHSNANKENNNARESTLCTTSEAVSRRRRLTTGGQIAASLLTPHATAAAAAPAWDGFVRKGTRFKSFLDDALQHVATGYAVSNVTGNKRQRLTEEEAPAADNEDNDNDHNPQGQPWDEREQAASAVAKKKTTEVFLLKQKLEEAQAQVASLTASNETLREESQASSLRFERTIDALKIAAANAASARTDADQAEASSESLSTQLEALQTVVQETKQASLVLYEEQQEISEQARAAQAKLLQTEADLARSLKETNQLREQSQDWQEKTKNLQEETTTLKRQLADAAEETRKLTKAIEERDALEAARKDRSKQIEQELREAQALLVDATTAAAETETMEVLKDSILELQSANKKLHEQLHKQQETAREEKHRLEESLLEAEKEAQTLRIEASLNSEQRNEQEANNSEGNNKAVSPDAPQLDTSFTISRPASMDSPTDSDAAPHADTCSICFKAAFGMMKKCQCGSNDCNLRAHVTCANRKNPGPSVSHPGTPGAKLPVILCAGPLANLQKKD